MTGFRKVRKLLIFSVKLSNADFGLVVRPWEDMALALLLDLSYIHQK